ncbi:hypothetical protein [Flavobacterium sp. 3HN19-14]|uniref:hypothetical protein n=1 Tax=Flavobacterium sp. 3HN19-14 TaxID=3448133 RepID=UPI003EE3B382
MRKSTTPFLVINVLIVLVFASCATQNVVKDYTSVASKETVFQNPYFANSTTDYVYKTNITVYGNELTGIFIAKKINESTHRVVFTTEFGNKLFDFEISENDFKVNSIVDDLNRKIIINTLKGDFRLLLKNQFQIIEQFENETDRVFKSADGKNYNYLFTSKADKKLYKIVHSSGKKQKFDISFTSEKEIANQIIIQHQNLKLRIALNYLNP